MRWTVAALIVIVLSCALYLALSKPSAEGVPPATGVSSPSTNPAGPDGSRQYTVLLDVSASRPDAMIVQGQQFVSLIAQQMKYGDRLVVLQMYEAGVNDPEPRLDHTVSKSDDVTSLEERDQLEGVRKGVKNAVDIFFRNALKKRAAHTDIITTLSIASETIVPDSHNCLILLSDMLQSSKDLEFEHLRRMPTLAWIDKQKKEGLLRPLHRSEVVVIGADPSTHDGVIVREFWQKYFGESDASLKLQDYRTTPPSDVSVCN